MGPLVHCLTAMQADFGISAFASPDWSCCAVARPSKQSPSCDGNNRPDGACAIGPLDNAEQQQLTEGI